MHRQQQRRNILTTGPITNHFDAPWDTGLKIDIIDKDKIKDSSAIETYYITLSYIILPEAT